MLANCKTIPEAINVIARQYPEKIAILDGSTEITYAELVDCARRFAIELRRNACVKAGERVAVCLPPGAESIWVMLGIMYAGATYVPLDPSYPKERIDNILRDAAPSATVGVDIVETAGTPHIVPEMDLLPGERLDDYEYIPDGDCYVIFTSGTTGAPKGVRIGHDNVLSMLSAVLAVVDIASADRWLHFHTIAFDFAVWEIWGCLLTGGTLVVADRRARLDPAQLADLIARERISILSQTPTSFSSLSGILSERSTDALRYVIFGGEALMSSNVRTWARSVGLDAPRLVNMFGITEATVHLTYHVVTQDDLERTRIPIGAPLPGMELLLIDDVGYPSDCGTLLARGPQIGRGYLNRPEETANRFGYNVTGRDGVYFSTGDLGRLDRGTLFHTGRGDSQIQLSGYRVEPAEILDALGKLPPIAGALLIPEGNPPETTLTLVYTTDDGRPLDVGKVRQHILSLIPRFMLPSRIVHRVQFPHTINGKIDVAAIRKELGNDKPGF